MESHDITGKLRMDKSMKLSIVVKLTPAEMRHFVLERGEQPKGMIGIIIQQDKEVSE